MANLTLPFKCFIFFFFLLMISTTPSSSSSSLSSSSSSSSQYSSNNNHKIQPQNPSSTSPQISHYHQVFYLKNANPPSRQERIKKRWMNRNKNKKHRKHRKKIVKNMMKSPPRAFSVMLPKGFVPPSASSPCHNDQPNSMSFHCHLSSSEP
ncbi:unnamed protein product [Lathyrus sativus]|nr:unnamed protein product [Lathyrus sativus]